MTDTPTNYPKPPAHVETFVEVFGADGAVEFLLQFGGAPLYLSRNPKGRSKLEQAFGKDLAIKLAEAAEEVDLPARIPTAKPWIAAVLRTQGLSNAEIARKLHVSDVTVRSWFNKSKARQDPDQPSFL